MGFVLAFFRLFIFIFIALCVALLIFFGRVLRFGQKYSFFIFRNGTNLLRFFLGVKLYFSGNIPEVPGVIMANHRSYIDVVLIPSRIPYIIVAKKQVRSWPVVGIAAIALKVVFVDRDNPESRRKTRESIFERLKEGLSVLIFPEGTTHAGPDILDFKPGMFQTSAAAGFSIIPVAIEYENQNMAWIGDDTFVPHFLRAFAHPTIRVGISFGRPLSGNDGDLLREKAQTWVGEEVLRMRHEWDAKSGKSGVE